MSGENLPSTHETGISWKLGLRIKNF